MSGNLLPGASAGIMAGTLPQMLARGSTREIGVANQRRSDQNRCSGVMVGGTDDKEES